MQILGLLDMYFDAVVVEVFTFFRLALAILCVNNKKQKQESNNLALFVH